MRHDKMRRDKIPSKILLNYPEFHKCFLFVGGDVFTTSVGKKPIC